MSEGYDIVPPLPPRYRFRDLVMGDAAPEHEDRVRVEFFVNEQSLKQRLQLYFIKNQRSSLRIRLFNFVIKLVSCVFYVVRVLTDRSPDMDYSSSQADLMPSVSRFCDFSNGPSNNVTETSVSTVQASTEEVDIRWCRLWWVQRPDWLWSIQLTIAILSLSQTLLLIYLQYKGNIYQHIVNKHFFIEMLTSSTFVITIFWRPLREFFIPVFLNCWLAKQLLENLFNDLHRVMQKPHSALQQRLMILIATILCLIFTCMCGVEHLERADPRQGHFNLFEAMYFTVVTFSTVGYGDLKVEIWPSRLFIMIMIGVALKQVPLQLEGLAYITIMRKKQGGTYSRHRAQTEKHVVVCATTMQYDLFTDFLNEFYAHQHLQDYFVVLLSPCELDNNMTALMQVPMWAQRVIYIQGSALKDQDLIRCRMDDAEACFILSPRNVMDRSEADQQTILRTWAVKDFAPKVPLYVQILKPENRFHVAFVDHVVCEDEFKYALLANNCLCPATSTFVTLLIHTSRGQEGADSTSLWQRLYGKCSGNEIYHIVLKDSRFFGEYEGKSFTFASFHAHKKYGVSLCGIRKVEEGAHIQLNPGPRHIMRASDTCFYMNITKEENSVILKHSNEEKEKEKTAVDLAKTVINYTPEEEKSPEQSRLETAIAGVGTVALELHHFAGSGKTPTPSPGGTPVASPESRQKYMPPLGREAAAGLTLDTAAASTAASVDRNHLMPPVGDDGLKEPRDGGDGQGADEAPPKPRGREGRRPSIMPVLEMMSSDPEDEQPKDEKLLHAQKQVDIDGEEDILLWDEEDPATLLIWDEEDKWIKGNPPIIPYIGYMPAPCHLLSKSKDICCLELDTKCEHCKWTHAAEYNWPNNNIIIAAESAALGMVNFIVPLRQHWRPKHTLKPIIILLEEKPGTAFLECIRPFPMVYYMMGTVENLDDLLRAGILQADTVVIVDKESSKLAEEDYMADANQIVAVQTLFKLFPHVNIITELTHPSNMRFMQFRAKDSYALKMAEKQKIETSKGSNIAYMFRLPFSAGNVFSASMLDTLLYQSFVKDYMISAMRLLLGLDQAPGSGYLCELRITSEDMWIRTYGRLYQKLCSTTHEIPIGVFRTHSQPDNKSEVGMARNDSSYCMLSVTIEEDDSSSLGASEERKEIAGIVRQKMKRLDLPEEEYDSEVSDKRNKISYALINPSFDMKLEMDDVIFIIRPAGGPKTPSPMPPRRKFSSRRRRPSTEPRAEPQGSNATADARL